MSDVGRVGPLAPIGDGSMTKELRLGRLGQQITADAHGRYHEAGSRGKIFILDSDAVTLAAANVTKSAMGTAKFITGFYNPPNSGFIASLLRAKIATTSGTPGGPYFYNHYVTGARLNSAETGTIRSTYLNSIQRGGSAMIALVNVALAVLAADTAALIQLGVMGGPAAIAAGAGLYSADDEIAGSIIVPPGTFFGIMCAAAGTSHVVQSSLKWEEVPLLAG